ncbi:MAG: hypothetical protein ACYC1M_00020 [Armatimonadota bacterium]
MNRTKSCLMLILAAIAGLAACSLSSADQVTDRRMKALQEVLSNVGKAQTSQKPPQKAATKQTAPSKPVKSKPAVTTTAKKPQPTAIAQVSWTPRVAFSQGGCVEGTEFGPRNLVARYDAKSVKLTKVLKAVWTYNDGTNPISTSDCKPHTNTYIYDNGISNASGPLQPGIYQVRYMDGSKPLAVGRINIRTPDPLGNRNLDAIAQDVLTSVQRALDEVAASRVSNAADYCTYALPLIGTAMQANPNSKDMQAMYEMAEAIIALHKLETAASSKSGPAAVDWCFRAQSHAQLASTIAQNPKLKAAATEYATMLQQTLDQISAPANKKGK